MNAENKLSKKSIIIFAFGMLLLAASYFFPIWTIDLDAPQYPEGMGLRIWADEIRGENEHDLNNLNKLNHYIGMKEIDPDAIPELKIIPFVLIFMILFGAIVIITKKKKLLLAWNIILILFLLVGLYDFYMWEYDYGHNLNPNAPIKVPGMAYQPPLIGSKQLLNITAVSLPGVGGILIGAALLLSIASYSYEKFMKKRKKRLSVKLAAALILLLFAACSKEPVPINYGNDNCDYCMMTIIENKFGTELITGKGKIFKFDSIECLAAYESELGNNEVDSKWVTDFAGTHQLINHNDAYFLFSKQLRSPMGLYLSAYSSVDELEKIKSEFGGEKITWNELVNYVKKQWE